MKKVLMIIIAVSIIVSSCSSYTCPTYGSKATANDRTGNAHLVKTIKPSGMTLSNGFNIYEF